MTSLNLGPLERRVMDCVWERRKTTVREVYDCLKTSRKIAYTTVMTVMMRLTEKGFLNRVKKGHFYIYTPRETKKHATKGIVRSVLDSLISQYGKEAVTAFTDELKRYK